MTSQSEIVEPRSDNEDTNDEEYVLITNTDNNESFVIQAVNEVPWNPSQQSTEAPVHLSSRSWHDVQLEEGNGQGTAATAHDDENTIQVETQSSNTVGEADVDRLLGENLTSTSDTAAEKETLLELPDIIEEESSNGAATINDDRVEDTPSGPRKTTRKRKAVDYLETEEETIDKASVRNVRERACKDCVNCFRKKRCLNKKIRMNMFVPGAKEDQISELEDSMDIYRMFPVNIPRERHDERECIEAKDVELSKFKKYNAYEVVDRREAVGCKILPMLWVLTEKIDESGKMKVKARLTVMGNREKDQNIRTDSPTAQKTNLRLLMLLANLKGWTVSSLDVEAAFLQTETTDRDIYVYPPKEAKEEPGKVWRLIRPVYGTKDASRAFYKNLSKKFEGEGCKRLDTDHAFFTWKGEDSTEDNVVEGILATHVDDILACGTSDFHKKVIGKVKEAFTFGVDKVKEFKYTGINYQQEEREIVINTKQAVDDLRVPDKDVINAQPDGKLNEEGQSAFRSYVGQLSALANLMRPDLAFITKQMATKQNNASKSDMRSIRALIKKIKDEPEEFKFPDLGDARGDWALVTFVDASYKSLPDKISSVAGMVMFMVNKETKKAHILDWFSQKLHRVCTSPSSAESMAMNTAIGRTALVKKTLMELMGPNSDIEYVVVSDSKNTIDAAYKSNRINDGFNAIDMAAIRESVENGTIDRIIKIDSENQLADALTKNQPKMTQKLLGVLRKGSLEGINLNL